MDIAGKTLWQVGAGDTQRRYDDICIKFDVMLAGPGGRGAYDEALYSDLPDIRNSLRRFWTEAKKGEPVLLRMGTGSVVAVGEIEDDEPVMCEAFADVDGWELQHTRRVRWFPNTSKEFPPRTLGAQARTFAAVNVDGVKEWVATLDIPKADRARELKALPGDGKELTIDELGVKLFTKGLAGEQVDRLVNVFSSLQRVASWYSTESESLNGRPSENETVCYLVVPFLLSLGWSQQTMAVEWKSIDVALFSSMPPQDDTLACVVEAKLLGRSVFRAFEQAQEYACRAGRDHCGRLVLTDGIRYGLYDRADDEFELAAYLNILQLRESYPALDCGGAVEAILGMAKRT